MKSSLDETDIRVKVNNDFVVISIPNEEYIYIF